MTKMFDYQIDPLTRRVTAREQDGTEYVAENVKVVDRWFLDNLARLSNTADSFIAKVKDLSCANEPRAA